MDVPDSKSKIVKMTKLQKYTINLYNKKMAFENLFNTKI